MTETAPRSVRKAAPSQPGKLVPLDDYLAATQPELAAAQAAPVEAATDIPLSPAAALAAAFEPTPEEAAPAPVVVRKAPTRIRKADHADPGRGPGRDAAPARASRRRRAVLTRPAAVSQPATASATRNTPSSCAAA